MDGIAMAVGEARDEEADGTEGADVAEVAEVVEEMLEPEEEGAEVAEETDVAEVAGGTDVTEVDVVTENADDVEEAEEIDAMDDSDAAEASDATAPVDVDDDCSVWSITEPESVVGDSAAVVPDPERRVSPVLAAKRAECSEMLPTHNANAITPAKSADGIGSRFCCVYERKILLL